MSCLKCDKRFESKSGNKARLREVLAKHMAEAHNISATCPTCYTVFDSFNNKRANQNSMEQHQQVGIFCFVEDLEIIEFRCTGPRSTPAPFVECRNSGAMKP